MLGNKKVHVYHVPSQKRAAEFYEGLPQTLKNTLNFVLEKKTLFLLSFQGSWTQFQSKRLVMLRTCIVTAYLYQARPDKPKIFWRYEITMPLIVHEYTLFVCIWSRHLKLYLRKWSLIQMSLKKHSLHITWISISISIPLPMLGKGCPSHQGK